MGHRGLAREIAAMAGLATKDLEAPLRGARRASGESAEQLASIVIRCPGSAAASARGSCAASGPAPATAAMRRAARRDRREVDLGRGRRDQLRPVGHGAAPARLRPRQARRRAAHRAQGRARREARDARRRRARARALRHRRGGRGARGVAGRHHGRTRHRGHRRDAATCCSRPPGGIPVAVRKHGAAPRPAHRRVAPLRARRGLRRDPRGARTSRRGCSSRAPAARSRRACSTRAAASFRVRRTSLRLARLRLLSGDPALGLDFAEEALARLGFSPERRGKRLVGADPVFPPRRAARGRPRRGGPSGLRLQPSAEPPAPGPGAGRDP